MAATCGSSVNRPEVWLNFQYIWDISVSQLNTLFRCEGSADGEESEPKNRMLVSPKFVLSYEKFSFEIELYFDWNVEDELMEIKWRCPNLDKKFVSRRITCEFLEPDQTRISVQNFNINWWKDYCEPKNTDTAKNLATFQFKGSFFHLRVLQNAFDPEKYLSNSPSEKGFSPCGDLGHFLWKDLKSGNSGETDFHLVAKDGKVFECHKVILKFMSPVFHTMLEFPEGKEARDGLVHVDLPASALEELLYFMYCGKTSEYFSKHVLDVLRGADMYDMPQLKSLCETELYREIDAENVGQMLVRADSFGLETLKNVSLNLAASLWAEIADCPEGDTIVGAGLLKMVTNQLSMQSRVIKPWKTSCLREK